MNRELVTGLAQLSAEKGLPKEVVSDIIARAIKRAYGDEEHIDVKVDVQTGAFKVYLLKTVTEKVEDPKLQIQLDAAKRIKPDVQLGDIVPLEESAAALGRIGAQTAKQVIQQSLREAEREQVFAEYADREGDIINAKISHFEAGSAIMELDRGATAILPRNEQAPHERYFAGQARKVVVLEVSRTLRGPRIVVSRAHKALVKRLFELEVPEIFHGQVEIVGIAREPGSRTKIAVRARQPGLDARGACIGQRGLRVQAIVNELGGEKIDIIEWAESPERYVANALEPAHVVRVDIVPEDKTAYVVVPDRQLSLAIGKEGQNARLAAKLTGWRIDIKPESAMQEVLAATPSPSAGAAPKAPRRRTTAETEPEQPWRELIQEDGAGAAPAEVAEEAGVPVETSAAREPAGARIRFAEEVAQKESPAKKKKSKKADKAEREVEVEGKAKKAPKRAKRLAVVDED